MIVVPDCITLTGAPSEPGWRQVALAGPDPLAAVGAGGPGRPEVPVAVGWLRPAEVLLKGALIADTLIVAHL